MPLNGKVASGAIIPDLGECISLFTTLYIYYNNKMFHLQTYKAINFNFFLRDVLRISPYTDIMSTIIEEVEGVVPIYRGTVVPVLPL